MLFVLSRNIINGAIVPAITIKWRIAMGIARSARTRSHWRLP
jgi:hypothetical protein